VDPEPAWTLCKRDSCLASAENGTTHQAARTLATILKSFTVDKFSLIICAVPLHKLTLVTLRSHETSWLCECIFFSLILTFYPELTEKPSFGRNR